MGSFGETVTVSSVNIGYSKPEEVTLLDLFCSFKTIRLRKTLTIQKLWLHYKNVSEKINMLYICITERSWVAHDYDLSFVVILCFF